MDLEFIITGAFMGLMCLILIYRVARGPHALDRMVAADTIGILMVVLMAVLGAFSKSASYLDTALVVALTGFIGTVIVSKYLEGKA